MPIRVVCQSCGCKLKAPDDLGDRRAQCPRCGGIMRLGGVTAVTAVAPPKSRPRPRPRPAPVEEEEAEFVEVEIAEVSQVRADEAEDAGEDTARDEDRPRKRKRKKKKRAKKRAGKPLPAWVWWAGGVGGVVVLAVVGVVAAVAAGYQDELADIGLKLAVMMPVSTGILIASMSISSPLAGGIEFGEPHIVIPKALALLLVINLIYLVPFGGYISLPFWIFGLMYLFDLDMWEARFLFAINWILNFVVRMFLLAAIVSALTHGKPDHDQTDQPDEDVPAVEQRQDTGGRGGDDFPMLRRTPGLTGRHR